MGHKRCIVCRKEWTWPRSLACFDCLRSAELLVLEDGTPVDPRTTRALVYAARYRYRAVRCGKADCSSCPHTWYVYRAWRVDGIPHERYLGPADQQRSPYERPVLRAPRAAWG
jgi:hypothetical protein